MKMRFSNYLNEAVNFKVGDLATYRDKWGGGVKLLDY